MIYVYKALISFEKIMSKSFILLLLLLKIVLDIGIKEKWIELDQSFLHQSFLHVFGFLLDAALWLAIITMLLAAFSKDRVCKIRAREKALSNKG